MNEDKIRKNMEEVMNIKDPMTKSLSLNKIYLDQHLVVGFMH